MLPKTTSLRLSLILCTALLAAACSAPRWATEDTARLQSRAAALAAALPMPSSAEYTQYDFDWLDTQRARPVLAKLYLPAQGAGRASLPLVVFSHGLGGSRNGYTYLGKYWAAQGFAVLHVQHANSDRKVWMGGALTIYQNVQAAAKDEEAVNRALDIRFALDSLLADKQMGAQIDAQRIALAGHSYGANTTLLVTGATVERDGQKFHLHDPRFKAAVVISAPPFYGEVDFAPILQSVRVPSLHISATGDEIKIPGYGSGPEDRIKVFEAVGSVNKKLLMFKDGSHSMFTDRLGTGGEELNPQVKAATRALSLAFLREHLSVALPSALQQDSKMPKSFDTVLVQYQALIDQVQ